MCINMGTEASNVNSNNCAQMIYQKKKLTQYSSLRQIGEIDHDKDPRVKVDISQFTQE